MKFYRPFLLACLLLAASFAPAAEPVAKPKEAAPTTLKLFVAFEIPVGEGKAVAFIAPDQVTGKYLMVVCRSTDLPGLTFLPLGSLPVPPVPPGPNPPNPPGPDPPVPPTPVDILAEAQSRSTAAAAKVPGVTAEECAKVGAIYKALATQVPNPIDSLDKWIQASKGARAMLLTPDRATAWDTLFTELGPWLDSQKTAGKLTMSNLAAVSAAIGEGITKAKQGAK
jgi:hypothetical protein